MKDIGVSREQTIMIDDMPSGCRAAQAAGIRCFGYVADWMALAQHLWHQ